MQNEAVFSSSRFFAIDPLAESLSDIGVEVWAELLSAVGQMEHPWSLMSLATVAENGPSQRFVVLRGVDRPQGWLLAYSDVRTPKIAQIAQCPSVSCLFYHPTHRVQVALTATAEVHHDNPFAEDCWRRTAIQGRRNYMGIVAPGSLAPEPSTNLHPNLQEGEITEEDSAVGRKYFAVIKLVVHSLDILWLRKEGSYRAKFNRLPSGWEQSWIEP